MARQYCCFCSLQVAPKDPDQVNNYGRIYHGICFKKKLKLEREAMQEDVLILQQEENLLRWPGKPY
jgi:hypothetical protein